MGTAHFPELALGRGGFLMEALLMQFMPWLAGIAAALVAFIGIYFRGKSTGKDEVRQDVAAKINEQAAEAAKVTQNARNEIRDLPTGGANQRLRDLGVMRDKPPASGQ